MNTENITLISPYGYAKKCGVSPQAINQRIQSGNLEIEERTGVDGITRRYIDIEKYPPENKRKLPKNSLASKV